MSGANRVGAEVMVVGGGLAGCEAAWQLAELGVQVRLVDMKPVSFSPAHQSPDLCELVCSNSLRSDQPGSPAGMLKHELRCCGSLVIACAEANAVPAGGALAVDRAGLARAVTERLAAHPHVTIERRVVEELPAGPAIIATGPLTGGGLAASLAELVGGESLYFYDAIAPIVAADSIDRDAAFTASRWQKGESEEGDYVNCPLDREQYEQLVGELLIGRKVVPHQFEEPRYFEGCLPIEVMAERGVDVLRYGPMRPVGLFDPRDGKRPYAVVQLRPENRYLTAYNLVGFQTRLVYPEQERIFRIIPALAGAEFLRLGSIHRNTYVDAPRVLGPELQLVARPGVRLAGLLTGVEGYVESCAVGLLAALFAAAGERSVTVEPPPATTAMGGLYRHITNRRESGQKYAPSNINFGLLPRLEGKASRAERLASPMAGSGKRLSPKLRKKLLVAERGAADFPPWWAEQMERFT